MFKLSREDIYLTLVYWGFVLGLVAWGCQIVPEPVEPTPVQPDDPAFNCSTACVRLRDLNCSAGENTAGGATCEQVCENVRTSGFVVWNMKCRSLAGSCDAVELCER